MKLNEVDDRSRQKAQGGNAPSLSSNEIRSRGYTLPPSLSVVRCAIGPLGTMGAGTQVDDMNPASGSNRIYGLGIDTGGAFTDAAVVDLCTDRVLAKAKARTTHHDLSIGLGEAVDSVLAAFGALSFDPALVGVSTTLATNSILEGKGGSVGLIGLGWTPQQGWDLGAKVQRFLAGGHECTEGVPWRSWTPMAWTQQ